MVLSYNENTQTHKHTNTQTHKHTNNSDSYLLNLSTYPSFSQAFKLNRHRLNQKYPLSQPSPLLTSLTKLTSPIKPKLKPLLLFMTLPLALYGLIPFSVSAALSATTVNTIQGTKPYLTFDKGLTRVTETSALLSITLSDGKTYSQDDNVSSVSKPIALPVSGQSLNDVSLSIPKDKSIIALSDLIGSPYYYWGDDDGDGQGEKGVNATGSLSVAITDVNGKSVSRDEPLSPCYAPYKVILSASDGELNTQYGDPSKTEFKASSETYYITPKNNMTYTCFAKPNLEKNYGVQPEWDGKNGFKLQSLSEPQKNFPRTGFSGAFFDITIAGEVTAEGVIAATGKTITQGGVTATLTAQGNNVVRIMLTGPNADSIDAKFTPSTFRIKSSSTNTIYNFELSKWFVIRPGPGNNYRDAVNYCNGLQNTIKDTYRLPSVSEFTNANGGEWIWGLSGQENKYARAIGNGKQKVAIEGDDGKGGLFAEWGDVYHKSYPASVVYDAHHWAIEPSSSRQYVVYSRTGQIYYASSNEWGHRYICVTP